MELSPHLPITDEDRWQAVADRDEAFDGAFVFAVATTGIYCRPSCPSRRAKRGNVQFYALPEAAGFRACLRCRPRDTRATDPKIDALRRLCRYMESSDEGPPTLDTLSKMAGLSPHYLQRSFKRLVGVTPRQYYDALRIERLKSSLRGGDRVTGALFEAGYGSTSRLYEAAPSQLGMTPAAYAKGGKGAVIAYAITDSPLDRLLVGATARGIAAVYLGDNDGALEQALHGEYPAALIGRDDGGRDGRFMRGRAQFPDRAAGEGNRDQAAAVEGRQNDIDDAVAVDIGNRAHRQDGGADDVRGVAGPFRDPLQHRALAAIQGKPAG